MSSFHATVSNNTDELLSNYHELLEKQSNSISLLRKIVINKDNSGAGLNYEEDGDGHIVSVSPCSCLPIPPSHTGLHVSSVVFGCGVNTSSSYSLQCSDGDCSTNTWPVCQDNTEELIASQDDETEKFIASHDDNTEEFIASQDDILQVVDEVHEVVTEGPQRKSSDDFDFGTEDTIMKNVGIEIKFPRFLFEGKNLKEIEEILNSDINDISLAVDYNYMVILVNTTLTEEFIASLDNNTEEFITSHDEKSEEAENGILQDVNKVYEVVTGR